MKLISFLALPRSLAGLDPDGQVRVEEYSRPDTIWQAWAE